MQHEIGSFFSANSFIEEKAEAKISAALASSFSTK